MSRSLFGLWNSLRADRKAKRAKAQQEQRRARKALLEPLEQRAMMAVFGIELISDAREVWNMQPGSVPTVQGRFRVYRDSAGAAATHGIYFNVNQGAAFTSGDGNLSGNVSPALTLNATASTNNPQYVNVTFAAGLNYSDIVFTPTDDSAWEFEEHLTVRINDFGTYTVDNSKRQATMRLEDWDRPHVVNMQAITSSPTFSSFWPGVDAINSGDPNMSLYRQTATISEGQSATIYFDRMAQSTAEETRFRFQVSGGAVANSDFTLSGANLVSFNATTGIGVAKFPVGATNTSFTYTATSDGVNEARESTLFTLLPSDNVSQFHKYWVSGHVPSQTTTIEIVGPGAAIPAFGIEKISDAAETWNLHGVPATAGKFRIYRDSAGPEAIYNLNITATPSAGLTGADGTAWPVLVHNAVAANHYITVYFAAGATYSDITYNPTDDSEWEFDESLTVAINAWPGVYNLDPAKTAATMAVVDWDRPHVVNMQAIVGGVSSFAPGWDAINSGDPNVATYKQVATVSEGQSATIYFDRMGVNAGAQETRFRFQLNSTTMSLSDFSLSGPNFVSYDSVTGISVAKYSVGSTNTSFTLTANADGLNEARESLTITLLPSDGGSQFHQYTRSGHVPSLTTTIDIVGPGAALPTFGIEKISDAVEFKNHNSTPAVPGKLRIHRDTAGPAATYNLYITATPSTGLTAADGTAWPVLVHSAVAPNHYITVSFPAGASYVDMNYNPTDDSAWEFDESIAVTLNDWPGVYSRNPQKLSAVLGVIDADRPTVKLYAVPDGGPSTATPINLALANNDPNASNMAQVGQVAEGSGATIYFQNEQVKNVDTTVRFQLSGSGTYGADFTLSSAFLVSFDAQTKTGVIRIPANSTTVGLEFDSLNEGVDEFPERAVFTLLPPDASISTPYTVTGFAPFANVAVDIIDKPNLVIDWFSGNGTNWTVEYTVEQNPSLQPITIRFYTTEDGTTPGTLLGSTTRTNSNELAVGSHAITVVPNFVDQNASSIYEHLGQRLLAVIDQPALIAETNESDNKRIYDGGIFRMAQQPAEFIYVHGTSAADDVLITKVGSDTRVRVSHPILYGSSAGDVSGDFNRSQIDVDILEYNLGVNAASLWKNTTNNLDVNGDGFVTPLDTLKIINELNLKGVHLLAAAGPGVANNFLDVNGDHFVSHADANAIFDYHGGYPPNPGSNAALDVNSDGLVNNADVTALYSAWDATAYSVLLAGATQRQIHVRTHAGKDNITASADVQLPIVAWGGAGNDRLVGGSAIDTLFGQAGNDYIDGNLGDDVIEGGADDDVLYGRGGNDIINGWLGNDKIYGGEGADQLVGSAGNDDIYGGDGNDSIGGLDGDDRMYGEAGDDGIQGGNGLDVIDGGIGADNLGGGPGNDFLIGDAGADYLDGGDDADTLRGDDGDDTLLGSAGNDHLMGGKDNDVLNGGLGDDRAYGGYGNDTITANEGADDAWGELGNDTYYLNTASDWYDTVGDNTVSVDGGPLQNQDGSDEVPTTPTPNSENLIVNGDFQANPVPTTSGQQSGITWYKFSQIEGWNLGGSSVGFELQRAGGSGPDSTSGESTTNQFIELDGDMGGPEAGGPIDPRTSTTIYQDVATVADGEYEFAFDIAARPGTATNQNAIHVRLHYRDGLEILSEVVTPDSTGWETKVRKFTGMTGDLVVEFAYAGEADRLGGYLDNVKLTHHAPAPNPAATGKICPYCPMPSNLMMESIQTSAAGIPNTTVAPIRYSDGAVIVSSVDLHSEAFGLPWGITRQWTSGAGYQRENVVGNGMVISQHPTLFQANGINTIGVVADGHTAWYFDLQGGVYKARNAEGDRLEIDTLTDEYIITREDGATLRFFGFSGTLPKSQRGQFKSFTDQFGNSAAAVSLTPEGKLQEVHRTASGVNATESYVYTYVSNGANEGLLESVELRRKEGSGQFETVRKVQYEYYTNTDTYGGLHDLRLVQIVDGNDNVLDTTYYRYYQNHEPDGYAHALKHVFKTASYAKLVEEFGTDLDDESDDAVVLYADNFFKYDSEGRATAEMVQGAGCSTCSDGQGIFEYSYLVSAHADDVNSWKTKTVETLPDGNENIVFTNYLGQVLLKSFKDSSGQQWTDYYRFDAGSRLVLHANPSAVAGYNESLADLVGFNAGNYSYLHDHQGVVTDFEHYTSTTATATVMGGVSGYLQSVAVRNGDLGSSIPQSYTEYIAHTAGTSTIYLVAAETAYANGDGTGALTTTTEYGFFPGTHQIQSRTTTPPSGSTDAESVVYDTFGRPIWIKDAEGYLQYFEYDPASGGLVKKVVDVDTSLTASFEDKPTGWSTPSGGGVHATSTYEVDSLGRPTRETDPEGGITYTVYNDAARETRIYAGWNTANTRSPTIVIREQLAVERPGNAPEDYLVKGYVEVLTMSAVPAQSAGRPTGDEPISELQSLSRTYYSHAGQAIYTDDYHSVAGLIYTSDEALGSVGTDFNRTEFGYDSRGRQSRVLRADGTIYRTVFDGLGRTVSKWIGTDDTPDSSDWSPINPAGMELDANYIYDYGGVGDSHLTSVIDTEDQVTNLGYDFRGRLFSLTLPDPDGLGGQAPSVFNYLYDNLGRTIQETDARGQVTDYLFEDLLNRVTVTLPDPDGAQKPLIRPVIVSHYDGRGLLVSETDINGVTDYEHDGLGRLELVREAAPDPTQPLDRPETVYHYDKAGNLRTVFDALLNATEYQYDKANRLVKRIDADPDKSGPKVAPVTDYAYDQAGYLLSVTDSLTEAYPLITSFQYDALGGTLRVTSPDPDGAGALPRPFVEYSYDAARRVDTYTDAMQKVTNYGYDLRDNLNSETTADPDGSGSLVPLVTSWVYDDANRLLSLTTPVSTTSYDYDFIGRLESVTGADPDGSGPELAPFTTYHYDSMGNLKEVKERINSASTHIKVTSYEYDFLNRLEKELLPDPDGAGSLGRPTTEYAYDDYGNLEQLIDPVGNTTTWTYDRLHRPKTETNELNKTRSFIYDAVGNLRFATDRLGRTIEYVYDDLHRNTQEKWYDNQQNLVRTIGFDYDTADQLLSVSDPSANFSYDYDGLGRITAESQNIVGLAPQIDFAKSYYDVGTRKQVRASIGGTADYQTDYYYDDLHRVTKISQSGQSGGNTVADKSFGFKYSEKGLVDRLDRWASLAETNHVASTHYTYDGLGRLTSLVHSTSQVAPPVNSFGSTALAGYLYDYDQASRFESINSLIDGLTTYNHDDTNQLTGADHSAQTDESYSYDENGNRTMSGYDVDPNNRLNSDGVYNYEYDDEGNRTAKVTIATGERVEYAWDHRNRLTNVTFKDSLSAVVKTVDQSYDFLNRWVRSSTDADGAGSATATDRFFVYEDGHVVLQFDGGSASDLTNRYVWGPMVDQILADEQLTSPSSAGNVIWPLTDHLNTVRDLADRGESTGAVAVANHRVYDSFGQLVSETNAAVDEVFGFTSRYFDEVSGLQNNWNRWYEAEVGRWISEDPIGFAAGDSNLERYVGNHPTLAIDPTGFWEWTDGFYIASEGAKGYYLQGAANIANGLQDIVIGAANLPAAFVNTSIWMAEASPGGREYINGARIPYIPSPDWSKGLVTPESDFLHGASKFCGGEGAATLLTAGASNVRHVDKLRIIDKTDDIARMRLIAEAHGQVAEKAASSTRSALPPVIEVLTPKQDRAIRGIGNSIRDHLTEGPKGDLAGALTDMLGNPVPKRNGGFYDHAKEVNEAVNGLHKRATVLEGACDYRAQRARAQALEAIERANEFTKGAGL